MKPPRRPLHARRPRGVTLISLMVGLLISMVVVVSALMLYQNLVRAAGSSRVGATGDAQRSAALLSAGLVLQDAGFGIAAPSLSDDLRVLSGASISAAGRLSGTALACTEMDHCPNPGTAQANAILWRQNLTPQEPNSGYQCAALLAPHGDSAQTLLKLSAPPTPGTDCELGQWASLTWSQEVLASASPVASTMEAQQARITLALFKPDLGGCSPFGIAPTGRGARAITLHATTSQGVLLESTHCLGNFPAPAAPAAPAP